uniref:LEDGF domain-containing protein n=1 Tax=Glossina pallidipes TaxID=7398 RepID=A0A1B0A6B5_GLOPL
MQLIEVQNIYQFLCDEAVHSRFPYVNFLRRLSFNQLLLNFSVEQVEAALNGEDIAPKLFLGVLNTNTLSHITSDTLTARRANGDKSVQTPINNFVNESTSTEDIPADVHKTIAKAHSEKRPQNRVVMSLPSSAVDEQSFFESVIEEEDYLFHEHRLVQLTQDIKDIKGCLDLNSADVDRCFEILTEYRELQMNKLVLSRNPDRINTTPVLQNYRAYVGIEKMLFKCFRTLTLIMANSAFRIARDKRSMHSVSIRE